LIIEKVRRLAHGFKEFDHYRLRICEPLAGRSRLLGLRRREAPRPPWKDVGVHNDFDIAQAISQLTDATVVSVTKLVGHANETRAVELSDGERLVVRILIILTPAMARQEASVQQALIAAGIDTPVSLPLRNGDVVGDVAGTSFTVSRFIDGSQPAGVTEELMRDFGRIAARFHRATTHINVEAPQWLSPAVVMSGLETFSDATFGEQLQRMADGARHIFDAGLPIATIHGDLWIGNVFSDGDRVTTVFDLETIETNLRIIDIARSALDAAFFGMDANRALREVAIGYGEVDALTQGELGHLTAAYRHVAVACALWNYENSSQEYALKAFASAENLDQERHVFP
jgi:Ser/Thr protein kinase RdoA (MazF antagonist)